MIKARKESDFIDYLKWLLEESEDGRGAMANLRHGLGKPPGTAYQMDRYILNRLPENAGPAQEAAYYLVASLFAFWHQGKEKAESLEGQYGTDRNLGRSLGKLAEEYMKDGLSLDEAKKRLEKRLNALLNSHRDDMPEHLRRIIALLKSRDIPINWAQLLTDIQRWDAENRCVQHALAKGFWVGPGNEKAVEINTSDEEKE